MKKIICYIICLLTTFNLSAQNTLSPETKHRGVGTEIYEDENFVLDSVFSCKMNYELRRTK